MNKNTIRVSAGVIFLVVAAAAFFVKFFRALLQIEMVLADPIIWSKQIVSAEILLFPAALVIGVLALLPGRDKFILWASAAVWAYCVPLVAISTISYWSNANIDVGYEWLNLILGYELNDKLITVGLTIATGLVIFSSLQKRAPEVVQPAMVPSQPAQFSQQPESPMPILALIGAFVFPIIGIVLGHLSLSQMKAGTMSSRNRGLAQAALAISYTIIGIALCYLIWILVMIASLFNY